MKIHYTVHSVAEEPVTVTAKVNGKDRDVSIEGMVVEIVSDDGTMSHTLRFSDDIDAARKLFVVGNPITLTAGSK